MADYNSEQYSMGRNNLNLAQRWLGLSISKLFKKAMDDLKIEDVDARIDEAEVLRRNINTYVGVLDGNINTLQTLDLPKAKRAADLANANADRALIQFNDLQKLCMTDGVIDPKEQVQIDDAQRSMNSLEDLAKTREENLSSLENRLDALLADRKEQVGVLNDLSNTIEKMKIQRDNLDMIIKQRKQDSMSAATYQNLSKSLDGGNWDFSSLIDNEQRRADEVRGVARRRLTDFVQGVRGETGMNDVSKKMELEARTEERRKRLGLTPATPTVSTEPTESK